MQALHGHRHSTLVLPSLGLGFSSESLPSQRRPTAHRQRTHKQSICRAVLSPEKPVLKVALNSALTYAAKKAALHRPHLSLQALVACSGKQVKVIYAWQ